ncbi:MAG: hypothetical protein NTW19_09020 [Planctomycetota bacterium]|nr:hypothetical protein [Planctomycetota bacterium]
MRVRVDDPSFELALPEILQTFEAFLAAKLVPAVVLTLFVTAIAYVHSNRVKMLIFSMPVPFSCAYLQSGLKINNTHLTGMVLVTLYHWIVFAAVRKMRWPLAVAIGLGAAIYIGGATAAASSALMAPVRAWPFLALAGVVFLLWAGASALYRPEPEPGNRSFAPWWIKSPVIFMISLVIFALTPLLSGGVTTFPYAGVFTSYEMRRSLKTLAGQYTVNNITFLLMFIAMWLMESRDIPRPAVLAGGWLVLAMGLATVYKLGFGPMRNASEAGQASGTAAAKP